MALGWLDFSRSDRNRILSVLDMLSEKGTLDELGISPVRDAFSNLFFPGTSTIQTRAKYFLIIPYVFKDIERSNILTSASMLKELEAKERLCGQLFFDQEKISQRTSMDNRNNYEGIIGKRSLTQGRWVARAPSEIYWAGIRTYGIFKEKFTISGYLNILSELKNRRNTVKSLRKKINTDFETDTDDADAGAVSLGNFWDIPTYHEDWFEQLQFSMTSEEGAFLKQKIIASNADSLIGYILKHNLKELTLVDSFEKLKELLHILPAEIQEDYLTASCFSDFSYALYTIFNLIVSDGNNKKALSEWERVRNQLSEVAQKVDLDRIFLDTRLKLFSRNQRLRLFLKSAKSMMLAGDIDGLKKLIVSREMDLKGSRAKCSHKGEFSEEAWFGGGRLDYRYSNARIIIRDIFESEAENVESL